MATVHASVVSRRLIQIVEARALSLSSLSRRLNKADLAQYSSLAAAYLRSRRTAAPIGVKWYVWPTCDVTIIIPLSEAYRTGKPLAMASFRIRRPPTVAWYTVVDANLLTARTLQQHHMLAFAVWKKKTVTLLPQHAGRRQDGIIDRRRSLRSQHVQRVYVVACLLQWKPAAWGILSFRRREIAARASWPSRQTSATEVHRTHIIAIRDTHLDCRSTDAALRR